MSEPRAGWGGPRFWPVFRLADTRLVGAELVSSAMWSRPPELLAREAARQFATGIPASAGWWLGVGLRSGQLVSPGAAGAVAELLDQSSLEPERLVLRLTEADLAAAIGSGSADRLARVGVRFAVTDFGTGRLQPHHLRQVPLAHVAVGLLGLSAADPEDVALLRSVVALASSLGVDVLAQGVETDDHVALADRAGIGLVQGFRWGSAGPLPKLVETWVRSG